MSLPYIPSSGTTHVNVCFLCTLGVLEVCCWYACVVRCGAVWFYVVQSAYCMVIDTYSTVHKHIFVFIVIFLDVGVCYWCMLYAKMITKDY